MRLGAIERALLEAGLREEQIDPSTLAIAKGLEVGHGIARLAHLRGAHEATRRERSHERLVRERARIDHEVDVLRGAGLGVGIAGAAADGREAHAHALERESRLVEERGDVGHRSRPRRRARAASCAWPLARSSSNASVSVETGAA